MRLADLSSRTSYLIDLLSNLREPLGTADLIDIPSIGAMTVVASGRVANTPQNISPDNIQLASNLDPAIFVNLPVIDQIQLLNGQWGTKVATEMLVRLKNYVDSQLIAYLAASVAYSSSAAYHDNAAAVGATVTPALSVATINDFTARMESLEGLIYDNLALFIHPMAASAIKSVSAFIPHVGDAAQQQNKLGLRTIGWINGIPVYVSQGAPRLRQVATSAWAITGTNTRTLTVAPGHGIVPGMVVSFATVTTAGNLVAPGRAVESVTDTTVVIGGTGLTNGSATEVGAITIRACEALLIDRDNNHVAQQLMPKIRIVPDPNSTNDVAQVTTIWGRQGRAGRVRVLLTPLQAA